ncbi:MAG: two-component system invasion response regulator UvrY [Flavobacteriales bacterium]|jgi:two-component system invasion response regulator UvrY|tara:strand:+ start:1180 stop:1833 length:654 start_codon:yes stop_codon:yes gene_type:complete
MGKLKKIKVHIADDHKVLIDGIIAVLKTESEIEVVGCSLNGEQVLQWYESNSSDVLILDINMPKVDGISVLQEFKKRNLQPKVIILSSYDDVKLVKEVMKIGAKAFLAKKCASEEIIEAIKTVSSGENYFSKDIQNKIVTSFSEKGDIKNTKLLKLITDREKEVLVLITKELNTREIAESLFISVNTVETHRKNLIKKLEVKNVVGLALFAHKNKLI